MLIRDHYTTHNFFVFDGKSSMDFNLGISGGGTYQKPHRRLERFTVPGRNGTLTISDDTFEDVEITYQCYFADGFQTKYQGLMDWLYSKKGMLRLEDTYHPEHFRLAEFVGDVSPETGTLNFSGRFELTFRCDGRLFLKSGERKYSYTSEDYIWTWGDGQAVRIINPTPYRSIPLIYTSEMGNFIINKKKILRPDTLIVPDHEPGEMIVIDCETGEVFYESDREKSINDQISFPDDLPYLEPGENYINSYLPRISNLNFTIVPRWFTI